MKMLATAVLLIGLGTQVLAQVDIKLIKLIEKREQLIGPGAMGGFENGITLSINAIGPDVQNIRKIGRFKVLSAADDTGADLTVAPAGAIRRSDDQLNPVRKPMRYVNAKPAEGVDFDLVLPRPAVRNASAIKTLTGEFTVVGGGEKKTIEIKDYKSFYGKPLEDPALAALGVKVTFIDAKANKDKNQMAMSAGPNTVTVSLEGAVDAIDELRVLAKGAKISSGSTYLDKDSVRTINYMCTAPVGDDAVIQIDVFPGQKSSTIPISLQDVKLP